MFWRKNSSDEVKQGLAPLFPRLWRYCLVLTGNRESANDLAQATCVRAIEKAGQFQSGTHLDCWVFTMAKRLWLNELRSQAVRRGSGLVQVEEIELEDRTNDPQTNLLHREVLDKVMALPEAQRETVLLVYVEGYSYKEAAEMLDIPIGTVMSRLSAARQKLATALRVESEAG